MAPPEQGAYDAVMSDSEAGRTLTLTTTQDWSQYVADAGRAGGVEVLLAVEPGNLNPEMLMSVIDVVLDEGGLVVVPAVPGSFLTRLGIEITGPTVRWSQTELGKSVSDSLAEHFRRFRPGTILHIEGGVPAFSRVRDGAPVVLASLFDRSKGKVLVAPVGETALAQSSLVEVAQGLRQPVSTPPDYGPSTLLPGEEDARSRISEIESERKALAEEIERLAQWRVLIGDAAGDDFTRAVERALALVLEGTEWSVDDGHEDVGDEDFRLIGVKSGTVLGEAKGKSKGVARSNVSQARTHYLEAVEGGAPEDSTRTLLVVNQYRSSEVLSDRNRPVDDSVFRLARQQSVLVLRSWDVFSLVRRALSGADFPESIWNQGLRVGGWLEVDELTTELHEG